MPTAYETRLWIAYLLSLGLIHKRTSASHFVYDYPENHKNGSLSRPIIVEQNWDLIPIDHINRSLRGLGKSMKDFRLFIKSQGKGKKNKKATRKAGETMEEIPEKLALKFTYELDKPLPIIPPFENIKQGQAIKLTKDKK